MDSFVLPVLPFLVESFLVLMHLFLSAVAALIVGVICYWCLVPTIVRFLPKLRVPTLLLIAFITLSMAVNTYDAFARQAKRNTPPQIVSSVDRVERFAITALNPPKHAYASFQSRVDNRVYSRVYLGKHCSGMSSWRVGEELNLTVRRSVREDRSVREYITDAGGAICG